MSLPTVAHETFVIERTYDVPVAQTFQAWSDPQLKARWFAGSGEALGSGYELDFRVGGREINRGGPPGGPIYTYESEFRDIVPEQRIIYTYEMHADESDLSFGRNGRVPWPRRNDAPGPDGAGVFLDGHDTVAQREEGTRSMLESLAASLNSVGS